MAKLSESERKRLPGRDFGLPKERAYPIEDKSHARNAKARASQEYRAGNLTRRQYEQINRRADKVLGE